MQSSYPLAEGDFNLDVSLPFESVIDVSVSGGIFPQELANPENMIIQFSEEEERKVQDVEITQNKKIQVPQPILSHETKPTVSIDFAGNFMKRSPHKLQGLQVYYCTLERRIFKYFTSKDKQQPQGILNFDTQEYTFLYKKDKKDRVVSFTFKPSESPKVFEFEVIDKNDKTNQDWVDLIDSYIRYSEGKRRHLQALALSYRFWRVINFKYGQHNSISEADIMKTVQTGDLLIFRSKGMLPSMQRSVTGSDYDHIVMFLRHHQGQNGITLFESSNQYGVIEFSFARFCQVRSFSRYEKIIFKKLRNISDQVREDMLEISKQQFGKGYSLSPMKLIRKSKRQNFFCSELIAYVYQQAGILSESVKACTYLPGHFSLEKTPIKLLKGAELSEDFLVDFYNY